MRIRRKAELAGRALEDAPPDVESIGGLYNPSNPSNLQNLKVSNLRKASSKQVTDAARDNFSTSENSGSSAADSSTFQMPIEHFPTLARVRKICFFWDSKRNCQHGSGCELLHTNEPGIPVADPPRGYVARPQTIVQETSLSNRASSGHDPFYDGDATGRAGEHSTGANPNYKIDVVCYFWFRDKHCKKGEGCQYLHTYDPSKLVASNPQRDPQPQQEPLIADEDYEPSLDQDFTFTNTKPIAPLRHLKVSHPLEKSEQICFFWHSKRDCSKGPRCEYLHTDDPSKPVASMPPGYHPESDPVPEQQPPQQSQPPQNPLKESLQGKSSQYEPMHDRNMSNHGENSSAHTVVKTLPTRATFDTICRFWATRPQGCRKGADCDFLHTNDPNLTVAPPPGEFRSSLVKQHRTAEVCRFWLAGTCRFTSNDCFQLHSYLDSTLEARHISNDANATLINDRPRKLMHELSAPKESHSSMDMVTTKSRERPQKSVSFAFDEPIPLVSEPQNMSPGPYSNSPPRREFENNHDAQQAFPTSNHGAEPITGPTKVKRAKLSMEDYKRKSAIKLRTGRAKMITFGGAAKQAVEVDTGELGCDLDRSWGQRFNSLPSIQFDQMCMAQDFRAMIDVLVDRALWKGEFLPVTTGDSLVAKIISTIAEELQDKSSALISVLLDFVIITYPTRSNKIWSFLDDFEIPCDQTKESNMRYLVFEPKIQLASTLVNQHKDKSTQMLSSKLPQQYRKDLVHSIHKMPTSGFLPHSHKKYDGNPHNYFLLFPPSATKSLVFLISWLRASYPGCKFFGSTSGSWEYFMKSDMTLVGVVLIHESIISEISRLPDLNQIIMKSKRGIDFWCISDSTSKYPMYVASSESESSTLGLLTATRLFPHGSVFLLTPSFVVAEPEKALLILNWFFGKELTNGKLQSSTSGTWKLVCCNNFSGYLLDLANSKACEREKFNEANKDKDSKDAEATQKGLGFEKCSLRYSLYAFFTKVERKWRQVDAMNDGVDFYSGIYDENESPIIYADRYIDCDNEKALVEWFAGWSLCRLNRFRRLFVIGTGSSSQPRLQKLKQYSPKQDVSKERPILVQETTLSPEKQKALAIAAKLSAAHRPQVSRNTPLTTDERTTTEKAPRANASLNFDVQYRELITSELSKTSAAASADELTPLERLEAQWNDRCKISPAKCRWVMKSNMPTRQAPAAGTRDQTLFQKSNWYLKELTSDNLREIIPMDRICEHVASRENMLRQMNTIERFSDWWLDRYAGASREDLTFLAGHLPLESLRRSKKPESVMNSPEKKNQQVPKLTTEHLAAANANAMSTSTLNSAFSFQYQSPDYTRASEPFRFDGAGDARPASSGTDSSRTSRTGIQSEENGTQFIPRSVRPSGTVRKEIPVKPGYIPPEDKEVYRAPAHRAGSEMSPTSNDNSRVVSNAASPSNVLMDMDLDSSPGLFVPREPSPELEEVPEMIFKQEKGVGTEPPKKESDLEWKEITFEPTSHWYRQLKESGGGWEHISVAKWDEAFYLLGVK
ncbi:hypothetical protein B0J14DRAFT_107148 [Halenospora varia]|nr:hypothetical protein B0J14DRAFT_107148 [Halenospora varia]